MLKLSTCIFLNLDSFHAFKNLVFCCEEARVTGLALAGAVAFGYSNIFVTSPSPENLRTLFEFVMKGFDTMGYQVGSPFGVLCPYFVSAEVFSFSGAY